MTTRVSTGCKIFIGPVAASTVDTEAEFEGLSYTEIHQVLDLGEFGDQSAEITVSYLETSRDESYKGTRNGGTLALKVGADSADAGQTALVAAEATASNYAFKVTLNDEGAGSPSNPTTYYFRGQ